MNSEGKLKKALPKNINGKKYPRKLEPKVEEAQNKSALFKEIQNKEKSSENAANKVKKGLVKLDKIKQTTVSKKDKTSPGKNTCSEPKKSDSRKLAKVPNKSKTQITEEEPSTSKKVKHELSQEKWQPPNWNLMLDNIREMRSKEKAPVDTMGCHKCADENVDEKTQRFHKLIALMLSSQTKDEITYHAMLRLRENTLTPETVCKMKLNALENILHPVSFYKNKAKYIQKTSQILVEKYDSDIPNNVKELVALPGVGPKMAHICMSTAWHEVTGIGVDVHVHRISNRVGWLPKPTKEPEQTRIALETWLPKHLWSEVNHLLVGFGQTTCTPVKPKCFDCLNVEICPSAVRNRKKEVI